MLMVQLIILQVIVFGAVIFFLKKILTGDTQSAINRLDLVYQDLLKKQKELNEKIKTAEQDYQQKKEEADQIVEKMKSDITEELRLKRDEMLKKAKSEAEEVMTRAQSSAYKLELEIERKQRNKILDHVADLMTRAVNPEDVALLDKTMTDNFLNKGKTLDLSSVGPQVEVVIVRCPRQVDEDVVKRVDGVITQRLGKKMKIETEIEPHLVAGIQLQFGTLILDGSFANAVKEASDESKLLPLESELKEQAKEAAEKEAAKKAGGAAASEPTKH